MTELEFVFRKKELIASTVVVSYDSKYLYLWVPFRRKLGQYRLRKILHHISVPLRYHRAWHAGIWPKIEKLLPKRIWDSSQLVIPRISGGLLEPFITLQKNKGLESNPYTTKESYLATIVHEFGHVYWNQHQLWWYSNKEENIRLLQTAIKLYAKRKSSPPNHIPYIPLPGGFGETLAFCTEYQASDILWPSHRKSLDRFIINELKKILYYEKRKDPNNAGSVIEPSTQFHDFSFVAGKILLASHPRDWLNILTSRTIWFPKIG